MASIIRTETTAPPPMPTAAVGLIPVWLFTLAVATEGFPRPPISAEAALACFVLGGLLVALALWRRWMTLEHAVYSLFPLHLMVVFDEISTTYKTPFLLMCAAGLTLGALIYFRVRARRPLGWLVLGATLLIVWALAWHATLGFWHMTAGLGYQECFPDAQGCLPLPATATPWWILFVAP